MSSFTEGPAPEFEDPVKQKALEEMNELVNTRLPLVTSLPEYYSLLQAVMDRVGIIYENIACKTGCNRCCKFYGSPHVHRMEWEYIKAHLDKAFSSSEMERVRKKFRASVGQLRQALEEDLAGSDTDSFSISVFNISECPFIYKNQCSIYEVRPFICRSFGNALTETPEKSLSERILTCSEERERWSEELEKGVHKKVLLPYLETLFIHLKKLERKPGDLDFNTIQHWLTEFFDEY